MFPYHKKSIAYSRTNSTDSSLGKPPFSHLSGPLLAKTVQGSIALPNERHRVGGGESGAGFVFGPSRLVGDMRGSVGRSTSAPTFLHPSVGGTFDFFSEKKERECERQEKKRDAEKQRVFFLKKAFRGKRKSFLFFLGPRVCFLSGGVFASAQGVNTHRTCFVDCLLLFIARY